LADVLGEPEDCLLEEMLALLQTNGRGRVFDLVLQQRGRHDLQLVERLVNKYRNHLPEIGLDPAVPGLLAALRGLGLKLGILTDGLHVMQGNKLKALGVLELVDVAICTDELGGTCCWKPSPLGFQELLQRLKVRAHEALFVGNDPAKDIEGARAVGMPAILLAPDGESVLPDVPLIRQLCDLIPIVLEWMKVGPDAKLGESQR
jgi:putative hydrolase of the HAD superfamily